MILRSIRLHPFCGIQDQSFRLEAGLNVLCGPNDIGKSTLFKAIESVFFLEIKPRANTLEGSYLKTLIPIGGDHARVTAEFECEGKSYRLEKTWGAGQTSRLMLPDGVVLNTHERITEKLRELLPASEATFRSVLFAGQNRLEQTIAQLRKNQDSLHSLGDVLRQAMSQTDGISVDRLKLTLSEKIRLTFDRWDDRSQGPEGGRGLERPWAHPGTLLQSWYERELLRKQLSDAQSLETQLGDKTNLLSARLARQAQARAFIQEHESTIEAITQRKTLSLVGENARKAMEIIQRDLKAWMNTETLKALYEPEIIRLEGVVANLKREQEEAHAASGRKALIGRFEKIEAEGAELRELRTARASLTEVDPADLEALRSALNFSERLKAGLSASKLAIELTARAPMELRARRDLDQESKLELASGQKLELQAGGRIELSHDLFELRISSGDGKMEETEKNLSATERMIQELLGKLSVGSLSEALEKHEAHAVATRKVEAAERTLRSLLGADKYDSLKLQYQAATTSAAGTRDASTILQEFSLASGELGKKRSELAQALKDLVQLKSTYASEDSSSLLILLAEKSAEAKRIQAELESLPGIPAEIGDAETLLTRFKTAQNAFHLLSEEIPRLSSEVADLKARLPEQTAQEFERQYREADQAFQKELRRGRALARVLQAVERLEANSTDLYSELQGDFEKIISTISRGKYVQSRMEGSLPQDFQRQDGVQIPFEWLSGGTKDGFALGLRLSMARHFLARRPGFVLVDDPMVAMDPERQRIAAQLVRNFAEKTQVLVLTCHPSHAELLGGAAVLPQESLS